MLIVITGTPGTGKTVAARALAKKLNYDLIDVKQIVQQNRIYRMKNSEKEVDLKKLKKILIREIRAKKNSIIENHLLCEIELQADFVFVFRCDPKILEKRMRKRGYKKEKIRENLLAEMLDYCYLKAEKNYLGNPIEVDTSKRSLNNTVNTIINAIRKNRRKIDNVDYRDQLRRFVVDNHGRNTG